MFPTYPPTRAADRDRILADPGFGRHPTDHLVIADWSADRGWGEPRILPRHDPAMPLTTAALHYGQSAFEGLKAFRLPDGTVATFRPDANAARLRSSARRLALPEPPEELTLALIDGLVRADTDWVPDHGSEGSLYLRPILFATSDVLGVRPSDSARLAVLASPAGPYFPGGVTGCRLLVERELVRAAPGGTGAVKCSGNYAAAMRSQLDAQEKGCDQVLFLDALSHRYVEECGSMNVLVACADGTVRTPQLDGSILPGITRDSLLALAPDLGIAIREEPIEIDELLVGIADGFVTEVFCCGTAAVITPVRALVDQGLEVLVGDGTPGPAATALRGALTAVQRGHASDLRGWMRAV